MASPLVLVPIHSKEKSSFVELSLGEISIQNDFLDVIFEKETLINRLNLS